MPYLGEIAGLATAICWSVSSIVFTAASRRIGALQVNLFRLPLALLFLVLSYLLVDGRLEIPLPAVLWLTASGIVGLAIGDTFLFQAMAEIGARLSMILMALAPPMTAILAFFFLRETISGLGIIGILVTIVGVIWVIAERRAETSRPAQAITPRGVLWGLMGALGQAVGLILAKQGLQTDIHALLATLIRMTGATLVLWPITLMLRRVKNPVRLFRADQTALKLTLLGVLFGPLLGVTLSLLAIKYTQTGIAATLMATVPVTMIPLLIMIDKEQPSGRAILGAIATVGGIAILFLR